MVGSEGMSLVEVLIAVALLGLAIATIAGGIGTAASASDRHRKRVNADTVIRSYAEAIQQRAKVFYVDCAASYSLPAGYNWEPRHGYTAEVPSTSIRYLQPNGSFGTRQDCLTNGDRGAQRLTLRVTSDDPRDTPETLEIVVRTP